MTVRDGIDQYIDFSRNRTTDIGQIKAHPIYRKILYLVQIDTLSCAAFSTSVKRNKARVIKFLDECSNWSERDRVNTIQLKLSLEEKGKSSGPLFDLIKKRIDSWIPGVCSKPSEDLTLDEVRSLACSDDIEIVDEVRYAKLFYKYRNTLIHEFREPGKGKVIKEESASPYYLDMDDSSTGESSRELVFPENFLEILCRNSINGLEKYLIENNLNPYDSYKFGTLW